MKTILLIVSLILMGHGLRAESPWLYGIHWYGESQLSDVEEMTGGKPIWTLETVMLYSDPWWQFSGQDFHFRAIHNKGHSIIIRIQPDWGLSIPRPEDREQFLTDLRAGVESAKDYCRIWQLGNEMNLYEEYGGDVLSAQEYAEFFKEVRDVIKSVESPLGDQLVLLGPPSPGGPVPDVRHTDGNTYLRQMLRALEPEELDGVAIHAYGAPWFTGEQAANDFMNSVREQIGIIDEEGFCDAPVFITEWNRQTNPATDAAQEAETARFLTRAFELMNQWNSDPDNHPIVSACWFIYRDDRGAWENFSIRRLKETGPRGAANDLWDAFQASAAQDFPAGSLTPEPCGATPTPTPAPQPVNVERWSSAQPGDLPYAPAADDAIAGIQAETIQGGFHEAVTNPADRIPAFTDGASLGALTGLLRDFPGPETPAWSGFWTLPEPVSLQEIRVFSGNNGADGRIFHHYDVYTTDDPQPSVLSDWRLIASEVRSAEWLAENDGTQRAMLTAVTPTGESLAESVTALRIDFYSVTDLTPGQPFIDQYNAGTLGDQDGAAAAFVSPLIFEVDAFTSQPPAPGQADQLIVY